VYLENVFLLVNGTVPNFLLKKLVNAVKQPYDVKMEPVSNNASIPPVKSKKSVETEKKMARPVSVT
jgi:hypothetical protein